ncbi:MAG: hypothetical protein ACRBBN_19920, partial [Methyloligellaceae bacterium]
RNWGLINDFLEMLIKWLDSLAFAIELVDGREVDLENLTKNAKQNNFLEKGPPPHKMVYGAAAVYKLRDILVDLRRCERNTIIDRALETNSKGRPKDNHRYAALKDEASRYYTYLRNRGIPSENACEIINSALAYWSMPQMSPDSIRKRSYSVKGSLGALLNMEDFYEKKGRPKDMTDEQEFGLYSALAILSLMHYAQEAKFALGILE